MGRIRLRKKDRVALSPHCNNAIWMRKPPKWVRGVKWDKRVRNR